MAMEYPTINEVKNANHIELATWYRFLHAPGTMISKHEYSKDERRKISEYERMIMETIIIRLNQYGGMTTDVQRQVSLYRQEF